MMLLGYSNIKLSRFQAQNMLLRLKQLMLFTGDIVILYLSLFLTFLTRYGTPTDKEPWQDHFWPFTVIFSVWITIFYINGLYDLALSKNDVRFYRRFFESLAIGGLVAIGFFYLTPSIGIAPKTNFFLQMLFFTVLFILWRALWNRTVITAVWKTKILFIGSSSQARELYDAIKAVPQYGFILWAVLPDAPNPSLPTDVKIVPDANGLPGFIRQEGIMTVVLGAKPEASSSISRALYQALFLQINFADAAEFMESITGRIPTARLSEAWFLENLKETKKSAFTIIKTATDYLLAVILGGILLIFIPLIALGNLIANPGALFYKQKRVGAKGKQFFIYKFRTMFPDAEANGAVFALKNDSRVTALGKFLRKTRLDELPQVWNILRGEMSFIGPRPERPEFVGELQAAMPFYNLRHLIKPGLTGWAQINFPYAGSIEENLKKLQYDLYYVKNRSLILDLAILLKTINIVARWMGR